MSGIVRFAGDTARNTGGEKECGVGGGGCGGGKANVEITKLSQMTVTKAICVL